MRQGLIAVIDLVVHQRYVVRSLNVPLCIDVQCLAQHVLYTRRHAFQGLRKALELFLAHQINSLCDARRVIAHPLQIDDDIHRRDYRPEVAGCRLLRGDHRLAGFF